MPIYMIGERGRQGPPFDRTFFNATIGEILKEAGTEAACRLHLYLTDGMTLEVCEIIELTEPYMVLRAYRADVEQEDDAGVHVLPYGVIYRMQIRTKHEDDSRVGFHWVPPKKSRGRKK
jgi:hypothetical protein